MSWRTYRLGEICTFLSGGTPSKANEDYWSGTIPWISAKDLILPRIYDAPMKISEEAVQKGSRLVPENTVLFVVRGMSLANEFRISLARVPLAFNQDLKALRPKENFSSEFIFYSLYAQRENILQRAGEASHGTKKLPTQVIEDILVQAPSLNDQEKVVLFIRHYDDLIENNRRRIQLLEESTRLLYREWFVHLRFPGHEQLKVLDGLPQGWLREPLEAICIPKDGIQTGPFGSQLHQSDYTDDGIPVVMPKDIANRRVSLQSIARIPESLANQLGRHRMQIGDTVYGRRGDIGRRAFIGPRQDGYFCGTGCLRFRPDPAIVNPRYLFDQLGAPDTEGCIINRAKGSTMPNLSAGALKTVPILLPPKRIQESYAEAVEPTNSLIETLAEQNQKLAQARDLLLPRLMNGEITV